EHLGHEVSGRYSGLLGRQPIHRRPLQLSTTATPQPQRPTLIANHGLGDPGWLPCPEEAVVDAVGEGLPGGGDDVVGDADGGPFGVGVGGGDQDAGDGAGAGAAVEDADLVVDQADVLELGVAGGQGAAE